MLTLPKDVEVEFTPTNDVRVQNIYNIDVDFQTNNEEEVWMKLLPDKILEIPAGLTVYFKSDIDMVLPTLEV